MASRANNPLTKITIQENHKNTSVAPKLSVVPPSKIIIAFCVPLLLKVALWDGRYFLENQSLSEFEVKIFQAFIREKL